ncbi:MAG: HAMP domain-containing sensor histidine kinase [Chloroflexota bacterium]|nr:HAMP domain-containing sensor histidine kinase [Chloroflexota bacterium]
MTRRSTRPDFLHPLIHIGGLLLAMLTSLMLIVMQLEVTLNDLLLLVVFMSVSGGLSIASVYGVYYAGLFRRLPSIRWALLFSILMLAALMFLNIWLTAQAMFISEHDYILMLALLLFASMVSSSCVFFVAHLWIGRIQRLGTAADRLAAGDLEGRLPVEGRDELARLTIAFNGMVAGLAEIEAKKRQVEQTRRDLISWVSHDLRTPLSTIRAMNEAILDGMVSDPDTTRRYIEQIQEEVRHLSHLIDDLFDLAQLDTVKAQMVRQPASLRDLVSDTLSRMRARAERAGINLSGTMPPDIDVVMIAPDKIQRVLYNLLDNALHHTPHGGRVWIQGQRTDRMIVIAVCNDGGVIPPDEMPHLFESFYRGDPARAHSGDHRGAGLGLAIARGFIEAHGGTISADSSPAHGTIFRFTIPLTT